MGKESHKSRMLAGDQSRFRCAFFLTIMLLWPAFTPLRTVAQTKGPQSKFFLGADITALDAPGRGRWQPLAYQEDGKPSDELTILLHHGWTAFRVRVFVSPVRIAPNNALENALPLARRIKAAGATLVLGMHFSDTWADPHPASGKPRTGRRRTLKIREPFATRN